MKKRQLAGLLACLMTLSACAIAPAAEHEKLHVLATTYPVYLFATAVTEGVEGVEVSLLVNQQVSCLHDYTLTVTDMKAIERADVVAESGLGLENFMSDALKAADAAVIDCSAGVETLTLPDGEVDPHIWMDPGRAAQMVGNLQAGLAAADPDNAEAYQKNALGATALLNSWDENLRDLLCRDEGSAPENRNLITFHDGFQYFAAAYDFTILRSIEEEEGSEASAQEIKDIVALIGEYDLPAIFTEINGSQQTAQAISRETHAAVGQLSMIMSGEGSALSAYLDAQLQNAAAIANAYAGWEVVGL